MSVVVPTLDTREMTRRCVAAALASRRHAGVEVEVVVVDDGSRDGTAESLAGIAGVRVARNEAPTGYSRAVNRGVAESRGELLVLLNSDALLDDGSLAEATAAFAADATLGVAGAALRYPDGTPQWSAGREPDLLWLFAQASGLPALLGRIPGWRRAKPLHAAEPTDVGWVTGAAMAVRAATWREHGPLDVGYAFYGQDLDFCIRARDGGWRVRHLPGFRAVHEHGATIATKEGGAVRHESLALLWSDLVLWAGKRRGPAFARRAETAIRTGARLRLFGLALASPFSPRLREAREGVRSCFVTFVKRKSKNKTSPVRVRRMS
ncbi:MAG: glycosyltransferase [Thermoanaerobaculia bacterium]